MNHIELAFVNYFKTKNINDFTNKGIWIIMVSLKEKHEWQYGDKDFANLCENIDLSKWYQVRELTETQVMKFSRENKKAEILKVTKSSIVVNA